MRWSVLVLAGALVSGGASASAQVFHSSAGDLVVQTAANGLDHPWALAFLPDRRMLVTERPGRMRIVGEDGTLSPALAGVPKVRARAAADRSRSMVPVACECRPPRSRASLPLTNTQRSSLRPLKPLNANHA